MVLWFFEVLFPAYQTVTGQFKLINRSIVTGQLFFDIYKICETVFVDYVRAVLWAFFPKEQCDI